MRRRIRLTESQLRDIVEESSRRVIQEMIDEGFWGDVGNAFKSGWQGLKNSFGNSQTAKDVTKTYNNAKNTATNAYNTAKQGISNAATNAYNTARQGVTKAGQWIGNQADNVAQGVQKYGPSAVATGLFGLPGWLATNPQAAGKVAGQVANGAQRVGNTIANGAQRIGNGIGNWLGSFRQGYNNQRR